MNIAEFERLGGFDQVYVAVERNGHVKSACLITGTPIEDIAQDAITWLLEHFGETVDQCPVAEDTCTYLVRQTMKAGIDAARNKRHGYHTDKGRPVRHIGEYECSNEDGSSYFDCVIGAEAPTIGHNEWFSSLSPESVARAEEFERALLLANHPLFPVLQAAQIEADNVHSSKRKALCRAYEIWSKTGRLPAYKSDTLNWTHRSSVLVRSVDDEKPVAEAVSRRLADLAKYEDKLDQAFHCSDKKYGLKLGKTYLIPVKIPTCIGHVSLKATSPYLPPKVIAARP